MEVEDGAEAVSGLHRLNAQLPYADSIPVENERLLAEVKDALDRFTAQSDFKLLLQACSGMSSSQTPATLLLLLLLSGESQRNVFDMQTMYTYM